MVFGGENSNNFLHDEGFVFEDLGENNSLYSNKLQGTITGILLAPRTIYSFAGSEVECNAYLHKNSIYLLRKSNILFYIIIIF